jgi:hypothetical protein
VPFTFRVPAVEDQGAEGEVWPASLANFPLGQWTADARRFYARGDMDADRVAQLEKLGMIWSHYDVAWEEGLSAARGWAAEHGHLLAPLDATFQGYRVGIFLKNARAAAPKAQEIEQGRAEGLPVQSSAGALSDERHEQLEEIDASWCPWWASSPRPSLSWPATCSGDCARGSGWATGRPIRSATPARGSRAVPGGRPSSSWPTPSPRRASAGASCTSQPTRHRRTKA